MAEKRCAPKPPRVTDTGPGAALFRALADPHRLHIFAMIAAAGDDVCVCDINEGVPLLQPTVSHHLKILRDCGLVVGARRGTWVYYRLADGAGERVRQAVAAILPRVLAREDEPLAERHVRRKRRVA
ncbi:MAG TPA: metalloregulator ArsR/SmtB family transcription factor [Candidatus Eremiobacteraceae bacterium]|nr:metalloregulator ArsR/SmtB family transcription factor [Candidatus Eremiobacteraceae bacterium]